jgi:hypothetical protein
MNGIKVNIKILYFSCYAAYYFALPTLETRTLKIVIKLYLAKLKKKMKNEEK